MKWARKICALFMIVTSLAMPPQAGAGYGYIYPDGEIVQFDDGKSFQVLNHLGGGDMNEVYEVVDLSNHQVYALRVPIYDDHTFVFDRAGFIDRWKEGYGDLEKAGIRVPKLYGHLKRRYVLAERIKYSMTGDDFFSEA